jgi:hypothetical protein
VYIAGAWDFATYGTCTLLLTDDIVTNAPVTFSAGKYEPSNYCVNAGVSSPSISSFCTTLATALTAASPTRTYDVTFDNGRYTITTDEGVTFALTFTGAAGTRFYKLLGYNPSVTHSATTYTSTLIPWFVIVPTKPGVTLYKQPQRASGATAEKISDAGFPYRLGKTSTPRFASWEHHFEPKERVDADWLASTAGTAASTHYYSWEQLWADYKLAQMPIGMYLEGADGNYEKLAFSLRTADYDDSVVQRLGNRDDKFTVIVRASLWPTATADKFARSFNV